jgi:hypothetical protein
MSYTSYHVVLTSLHVLKIFYHTFFFFILWSDGCYHHVVIKCSIILIITSYLSSYIVISKFFFLLSSLSLQCVVTQHSWCCEIVMVLCVDSLGCAPSWNFVSKKSSRTFVIPARTSLRSHAPAFMSPTCG